MLFVDERGTTHIGEPIGIGWPDARNGLSQVGRQLERGGKVGEGKCCLAGLDTVQC